jgi:alkylation response protein AidB-like acyl-CoA dehydrogenase
MNFSLSEEQKRIRDRCCQFTENVITPQAEEMDTAEVFPYQVIAGIAGLGIMGIPFPQEYGGGGGDWVSMSLCMEEVSRGDAGLGLMLDVTTVCAYEVEVFGTEVQKQRWLPPLVTGEGIGSFGLTEPYAGSDAAAIRCTATLDGDEWVINGRKQFITNIGLDNGSIIVIVAVSGKDRQGKSIFNTFVVPKGTPGFIIGRKYDKIGLHSCATNELTFEDCHLPKDYLLGEVGQGLDQHLAMIETGRLGVAACSVGLAQACLNVSLAYAKERFQFGRPIAQFEGVAFKLADMTVAIEAARLMYLKAAWLKDMGLPYSVEAAAAKLYASEMVEKVASYAMQIHGGYGYMNDCSVSRYYRQAKAMPIAFGTSEMQRIIINRNM